MSNLIIQSIHILLHTIFQEKITVKMPAKVAFDTQVEFIVFFVKISLIIIHQSKII